MTKEITQLVRNSILRMLDAAPVNGLAVSMLSIGLQSRGLRDIAEDEIKAELQYLADKGCVARVPQKISPELAPWRITAEGRDELAS